MRVRARFVVAIWVLAASAWGSELELAFRLGWTAPTYEQTFQYDPGSLIPTIPGVDIRQEGVFRLDARGALAFGGGATFYVADFVGIEGRIDTVDFDVQTSAPRFEATVALPPPLPDLTSELDLERGSVDVDRVRPLSLNLKLRTPGSARLVASGGLSFLPELRVSASQTVALGIAGLGDLVGDLDIPTVEILAEARPQDDDEGRLGFNLGAGVEVSLGGRLALEAEARYFHFQKQTIRWRRARDPDSPLEELLLQELENSLPPIEFEPVFFQASVGIVLSF